MKRLSNDDPLSDSKMSFGEHLDELRSALIKAIIAFVACSALGLLVGDHFLRFVKAPLDEALQELEQKRGEEAYAEADAEGLAGDQRFADEGLVPEGYVIDPRAMVESLRSLGAEVQPPEELPDRLPLWLWRKPEGGQVISTGVPDVFSVYVKASLVVGAVLSSPFVFYFLWTFVAAGLFPHEKRYVRVFLPFSIGLFLLGATVAFYIVLKYVITFLLGFNDWLGIEATPRINEWLGFVLILPVMFGVAFQLPLVMLFLERIGVATAKLYVQYWKYAVLVIFVISMFLTPADPQSLIAMAGCLTPLYFGGVLLCKYLPRGGKPFSERVDG